MIDYDQAMELASSIIDDAENLPDFMEGFAAKVDEWATTIMETIENTGDVTERQEAVLKDLRDQLDNKLKKLED